MPPTLVPKESLIADVVFDVLNPYLVGWAITSCSRCSPDVTFVHKFLVLLCASYACARKYLLRAIRVHFFEEKEDPLHAWKIESL